MQISPEQGQFMALLVKLMVARKILEIGTFTGYSSTAMALALPDDGLIVCCDLSWSWTAKAREYWQEAGVDNKIDLRLAPALSTVNLLIEEGWDDFDIVFIDADKENYLNYYEAALKLLRPGGLIMVDNVLWGGDVVNEANHEPSTEAIRAFNRFVRQDDRVEISLIPVGDGLSLLRKR
jgi:caffeoyl-CoA O-methyltransferase